MKDENGLEVSTGDTEVISILGNFRAELLKIGKGVADILTHAETHPESTLIQACCACVHLYSQ